MKQSTLDYIKHVIVPLIKMVAVIKARAGPGKTWHVITLPQVLNMKGIVILWFYQENL